MLVRRLWSTLAGICVGYWLGAGLMTGAFSGFARIGLGAAIVLYTVLGSSRIRLHAPREMEWWLRPTVGIVTEVIAAGKGVFVIPSAPYLQAIGLREENLVQALGITFTVSTFALAGVVAYAGFRNFTVFGPSCVALVAAFSGMMVGQTLLKRLSEPMFRTCFCVGLLGLGVNLILRELL